MQDRQTPADCPPTARHETWWTSPALPQAGGACRLSRRPVGALALSGHDQKRLSWNGRCCRPTSCTVSRVGVPALDNHQARESDAPSSRSAGGTPAPQKRRPHVFTKGRQGAKPDWGMSPSASRGVPDHDRDAAALSPGGTGRALLAQPEALTRAVVPMPAQNRTLTAPAVARVPKVRTRLDPLGLQLHGTPARRSKHVTATAHRPRISSWSPFALASSNSTSNPSSCCR